MDIIQPTDISFLQLIRGILRIVPALILLVFLAMILYGGFVRMTAAGDPDKEKQSSQILTAGITGFIIIALAALLVNIMGRLLGINVQLLG